MACHSCRGRIAGVCYKCVECVDYMICSTCEAYGVLHTGHNILRLTSSVSPLFHPVSGDVHQNVECESCHGPVRGSRYKCLQCPEVDLCHTCEARGTEHSHHLFIRLPSRIPVVPLTPDLDGMTGESFASEEHPGVSCNSCHQGVRGRRFKCLVCPDFNLCSNCEQSEEQHFHHPMIRFSKPSAIVLRSSVILPDGLHYGVTCKECAGGIRGYRYKCLKCQDYDLCMRCEAASKHLHHRMLRIPPKCESAAHLPSNQLRPVLQPESAPRERAAARAPYLCPCGEMCREKPRYVCLQCPSYGHCPQCEARKTHKEHIMLRVPEPTFAFNYQPGVRCGGCGNAITDIRYRCITCPGFHLCLTCEERKPHSNHPTLRMLARTNPAATEMNQSSAPLVHGRVLCTGCKGPIIGFRYECVSCQEVSLCGKCEEKDNTHLEHPLLRFPTFVAQRYAKWTCGACMETQNQGARYKCLACPEFDLCSSCAAGQNHTHHPMLRLQFTQKPMKPAPRRTRPPAPPPPPAAARPLSPSVVSFPGGTSGGSPEPAATSVFENSAKTNNNDENLCKLCLDKELNCVFPDCGHMVACLDCAKKITGCPICRKAITNRIRIYKA